MVPPVEQNAYPQPYGSPAAIPLPVATTSPVYQTVSPAPAYSPQVQAPPLYSPYPQQSPPAAPPPYRQSSLPTASPSLPQRPEVETPHVNSQQMQQIHTGITPPEILHTSAAAAAGARNNGAEKTPAETPVEHGNNKKEKSKPKTRLVYSDNEVSPEEKMAGFARYAFVPDRKEKTAVGGPTVAITGMTRNSDDVIDVTHD